ncbi:MAG: hypothetical protein WCJ02_11550 [bacterium]
MLGVTSDSLRPVSQGETGSSTFAKASAYAMPTVDETADKTAGKPALPDGEGYPP